MTDHPNTDSAIVLIIGWTASFFGNVLWFGGEIVKSCLLGAAGAAGALLVKLLYNKYIKHHIEGGTDKRDKVGRSSRKSE